VIRRIATAAVIAALVAGCAGPSFTYRDYERKAAHTADEAGSVVQTALLAVRAASDHRATRQFLDVVLTDAESALNDVEASLDGVQPPEPRADQLRAEAGDLLSEAGDVLATLRIEVRRGHVNALSRTAEPLPELRDRLDAFAETHR
jgi:hypothetical protein